MIPTIVHHHTPFGCQCNDLNSLAMTIFLPHQKVKHLEQMRVIERFVYIFEIVTAARAISI